MASVTIDDITQIHFGMGSSNAAIIMDPLSAVMPKAVSFLGKSGGLTCLPQALQTTVRSGALLLVSDQPMIPDGEKTEVSEPRSAPSSSRTISRSVSGRLS